MLWLDHIAHYFVQHIFRVLYGRWCYLKWFCYPSGQIPCKTKKTFTVNTYTYSYLFMCIHVKYVQNSARCLWHNLSTTNRYLGHGNHMQLKTVGSGPCHRYPERKVHGANMGPIWGRQDPGGPHVGHVNIAIYAPVCCPKVRIRLDSKLPMCKKLCKRDMPCPFVAETAFTLLWRPPSQLRDGTAWSRS